jgi:hypothetical protein
MVPSLSDTPSAASPAAASSAIRRETCSQRAAALASSSSYSGHPDCPHHHVQRGETDMEEGMNQHRLTQQTRPGQLQARPGRCYSQICAA